MSAKNKKLLAVLGAAAVVVIVIAAVLLGKGGQTTTVDPASTPSDVSAEDVDSSNTPDSSSSEPLVVVPDTSKPEATDSQNQTDAVLNVEEEDQVDVNLTDSEKNPKPLRPRRLLRRNSRRPAKRMSRLCMSRTATNPRPATHRAVPSIWRALAGSPTRAAAPSSTTLTLMEI